MPLKIGLIVGERSGDALAAGLMSSLKKYYPDLIFEGVLGPQTIALGGSALYPMETLSVMGFIEPLKRLPQLFRMRKALVSHFIQNPPDIFIGVDAPEFNLGLEQKLKKAGIKTVHYVSPSVWAWRQNRIKTIKKSVDLMLTLFPFEAHFYENHRVPVQFVGHPFADQIPLTVETEAAKIKHGFSKDTPIIGLLPGSRTGELHYLAEPYLLAAQYCFEKNPRLQFVVPLVSEKHSAYFQALHKKLTPHLPVKIMLGKAREVMSLSDVVLVTSGTATLETLLHKKPMVVAYRTHPITYYIAKKLVKVPYIALPNLLANERLVPEFIQDDVQPELLGKALLEQLSSKENNSYLLKRFTEIHTMLKQNASEEAAKAIINTMKYTHSSRN